MLSKRMFKMTAMAAALTAVLCGGYMTSAEAAMRASQDIVNEMGVGWNLGNTLDAIDTSLPGNLAPEKYETCWGNPVTTKAMVDKIKDAGFKTIRIPITWGPHIGAAPEYKVNEAWMNRVQQVVDYAIDDGLYVIINVHHDSDWCIPNYNTEKIAEPKLKSLWTQIANNFKDYDDHLIFETLNEPRVIGSAEEWSGGTHEGRDMVNRYNQAALDSIRATGGNNEDRSVMVPTYAAACYDTTVNDFKIPNDDNVIVSVHAYSPYWFAMATEGDYETNKWGSAQDKQNMDNDFDYYYNKFTSKGTPVVIGEFGSINKANLQSRVDHARYFVSSAVKRNMACIWWDNNYTEENKGETFGLLNRNTMQWFFPEIKDALIAGYTDVKGTTTPDKPVEDPDKPVTNSDLTIASSKLNSWGSGYQMDLTLKNTTNSDIDGWTLKIKKSSLPISVSWDADLSDDGEYTVFTPKAWKTKIPAGQSITVSFQGSGAGAANFDYVLTK